MFGVSIKVCTRKVSRERSHAPALAAIARGVQDDALFAKLTLYIKKAASQPVLFIERIVFVNPEGHRLSAGDFPRAIIHVVSSCV